MPRLKSDLTKTETVAFGRRLRKMRESRGWSQDTLATKAGMSQVLISTLESHQKQPGWHTVCLLAAAMECSTEEFR